MVKKRQIIENICHADQLAIDAQYVNAL